MIGTHSSCKLRMAEEDKELSDDIAENTQVSRMFHELGYNWPLCRLVDRGRSLALSGSFSHVSVTSLPSNGPACTPPGICFNQNSYRTQIHMSSRNPPGCEARVGASRKVLLVPLPVARVRFSNAHLSP